MQENVTTHATVNTMEEMSQGLFNRFSGRPTRLISIRLRLIGIG
ncbi:Bgt-50084 [Blumeria graminis f. sp. tritici]|uniref:Bgt-50084 n=1 Tax=Blumeria graminis f. sp. tritici TaxID=62690 RepID=A0A9X9MNG4_BLUGR|nr:Bgt-50084 [Blumeria graminis f. sp. tritici]